MWAERLWPQPSRVLIVQGPPALLHDGLFLFAGLWERWHDPQGEVVETCTILTATANELMRTPHDRMPVILDPASDEVLLDPRVSIDALHSLLLPYASDNMEASPVDLWVNNPKNEGQKCLDLMRA